MIKENYEILNKKKILSFLIVLIPLFLISGPFLTDLTISCLAISFFFIKNKKKYLFNYFFLFFLFFYLILLVSSYYSEFKMLAFKSSIFYFRFGLYTLLFWYLIDENKNILKNLFFILFFCFSILIFDSFFQYVFGFNIFNMKLINPSRVSSFFGDELKMGGYLMRLSPLLLSLVFIYYRDEKHKKFIPFAVCYILLIQTVIYLSGERTSFFLFYISILLYLVFLNNFLKVKLVFISMFVIITFLLISIDSPFKKRLIDRTINHTKIFEKESKKIVFSQKYNEHYISAWRMFKDNKIIGIGPKNFREICKKTQYNLSEKTCSNHPHNIILQLLSETGFLGFLFYLILNIFLWGNLIKSLIYKLYFKKIIFANSEICLLIYYVIIFFPIAPFGNFFNNWMSAVVYFPAAIFLCMVRKNYKAYIGFKGINNIPLKKYKI